MFDRLKAVKALSDPEMRVKIQAQVLAKVKSQKAQEATAVCIAEGLGEPTLIEALTISRGEGSFLPLKVTVTADGEVWQVESLQPQDADFDYSLLCEDFNTVIAENEDMESDFLQGTAKLLNTIIAENGVAKDGFATVIA